MKINFLTKDPAVFPTIPVQLPVNKPQKGPSDARIVVLDRPEYPVATPTNRKGDFLYKPGQPQFDACEPYGVLKLGMALYSDILQRSLPFAFHGKLRILPHDGEGINAYYSRQDQGVHFLYFNSPELDKELEMAESLDVSAHEEDGHMLLDGLRPHYLNLELESQAFHEAFGDISAMILALQFDQVIDKMLSETNGDLTKSNVLSRLGEEAGGVVQALSPNPKKNHNFLRDSVETMKYDWKYTKPEMMEDWDPKSERKLGSEPHNFSRLFSGIWYEILTTLYKQDPVRDADPKQAVKNARDLLTKLTIRGIGDFAPDTTATYEAIAKAMLSADRIEEQEKHRDLLLKIFQNRNLLLGEEAHDALPKIKLDAPILTRSAARKFISSHRKQLGIDKNILLEPAEDFPFGAKRFVYRNKKGETFLVYHAIQDFSLHGSLYKELDGAGYKIMSSIKLGFDKNGNLTTMASDLITEDKRRKIERNIRQLLENQHVLFVQPGFLEQAGPERFFKQVNQHKIPYFAYTAWKHGKMTLERIPIFT